MKYNLQSCITLDLEPDHAGLAPEAYKSWQEKNVIQLIEILKKHKVKLSIFVVTKSLKENGSTINLFQKYGSEFHLHSHSHLMSHADSIYEIKKGKKEFRRFFNKIPLGYRAPMGLITQEGLCNLKSHRFLFDSSIIPTFWPKFKFFFYPKKPYIDPKSKLVEIPISTISPFNFLISLSWIKLFGLKFYKLLLHIFKAPNPLVFTFHLHDISAVPAYNNLPLKWKLKYIRNKNRGLIILDEFLSFIKQKGYNFTFISSIV